MTYSPELKKELRQNLFKGKLADDGKNVLRNTAINTNQALFLIAAKAFWDKTKMYPNRDLFPGVDRPLWDDFAPTNRRQPGETLSWPRPFPSDFNDRGFLGPGITSGGHEFDFGYRVPFTFTKSGGRGEDYFTIRLYYLGEELVDENPPGQEGNISKGNNRWPAGFYEVIGGSRFTDPQLDYISNTNRPWDILFKISSFNRTKDSQMFSSALEYPDPVEVVADKISEILAKSANKTQYLEDKTTGQSVQENVATNSAGNLISSDTTPVEDSTGVQNESDQKFLRAFYFDYYIDPERKRKSDEGYDADKSQSAEAQEARVRAQNDSIENQRTLSEQGILLWHLVDVMQHGKDERKERGSDLYRRFATLDLKDGAHMRDLGNLITSRSDMSYIFEDLKPIHLSAMIPRVRVYKPVDRKGRDGKKETVMAEYEFEQFPDEAGLTSGTNLGTSTGVGLMSFDWVISGNLNVEEAKRYVRTKMRIRAQSVDELLKERTNDAGHTYSFSDIFWPREASEEIKSQATAGNVIFSPHNLENQVVVEYAIDRKSDIWRDHSELADRVEKLKVKLKMMTSLHTISLNDDGSLFVDLDFQSSVDATTNDPRRANILADKLTKEMMAERQQLLVQRAADIVTYKDLVTRVARAQQYANKTIEPGEIDTERLESEDLPTLTKRIRDLSARAKPDLTAQEFEKYMTAKLQKKALYATVVDKLITENRIKAVQVNPCDVTRGAQHIDFQKTFGSADYCCPFFSKEGYKIPYFFYGDLLEVVLDEQFTSDNNDSSLELRTVLGPMTIIRGVSPNENPQSTVGVDEGTGQVILRDRYNTASECHEYKGTKSKSKDPESEALVVADTKNEKKPTAELSEEEKEYWKSEGLEGMPALLPEEPLPETEEEELAAGVEIKYYDPKPKFEEASVTTELSGPVADPATQTEAYTQEKEPCSNDLLTRHVVNIADIPISFRLFQRWWSEKVVNKSLFTYPLKRFISESINSLIVSALEEQSPDLMLPAQRKNIITTAYSAHVSEDAAKPDAFGFVEENGPVTKRKRGELLYVEDLANPQASSTKASLPLTQNEDHRESNTAPQKDYLFIFAQETNINRYYGNNTRDYRRDVRDGIYHLHSGQDAGVVKDIKMNAVTWSEFETYNTMQAMLDIKTGPKAIPRIYNATVTLYGTPFFCATQEVYIKPTSHGTHANLLKLGLPGYFTIVNITNRVENGSWTTTLDCTFKHSGELRCDDAPN